MKKIQVIPYDRRTEVRIEKHIDISATDIQDYLKERFIKANITTSESPQLFIYKINTRLLKKDAVKLAIKLHEIAGLDYEVTQRQKPMPKPKKQGGNPNIITGFEGNLITEFNYLH